MKLLGDFGSVGLGGGQRPLVGGNGLLGGGIAPPPQEPKFRLCVEFPHQSSICVALLLSCSSKPQQVLHPLIWFCVLDLVSIHASALEVIGLLMHKLCLQFSFRGMARILIRFRQISLCASSFSF